MRFYTTTIFGEKLSIRGDFSNAASPIERLTVDGWEGTQYQVADFYHQPWAAMEREIELLISSGGDDPNDYRDEIAAACDNLF